MKRRRGKKLALPVKELAGSEKNPVQFVRENPEHFVKAFFRNI